MIEPVDSLSRLQDWLTEELGALDAAGLRRQRRTVQPLPRGRCVVDDTELLNFATNDYLGLAADDRVLNAARQALADGVGARASALICGRTRHHEELEAALAGFEGTDAALVFPTGYAANVGTLTGLVRSDDVVFCDRMNHASLIDGCRLSGAKFRVYRHDRLDVLERELNASRSSNQQYWIVTDSVFSMDGVLAPLASLCDLAEKYAAHLIVDEAHGTGVFGECGRGVCELLNVGHRVAVRIGTLSKAVGTQGGFVAGSRMLIDWLWNSARTQMFSTALAPPVCAAANAALKIVALEPERRQRLLQLSDLLRSELLRFGCPALEGSIGPIVPVLTGTPEATLRAAAAMANDGFLIGAIRPPTVPEGTSRLRISISASHSETDVRALAIAVARATASLSEVRS